MKEDYILALVRSLPPGRFGAFQREILRQQSLPPRLNGSNNVPSVFDHTSKNLTQQDWDHIAAGMEVVCANMFKNGIPGNYDIRVIAELAGADLGLEQQIAKKNVNRPTIKLGAGDIVQGMYGEPDFSLISDDNENFTFDNDDDDMPSLTGDPATVTINNKSIGVPKLLQVLLNPVTRVALQPLLMIINKVVPNLGKQLTTLLREVAESRKKARGLLKSKRSNLARADKKAQKLEKREAKRRGRGRGDILSDLTGDAHPSYSVNAFVNDMFGDLHDSIPLIGNPIAALASESLTKFVDGFINLPASKNAGNQLVDSIGKLTGLWLPTADANALTAQATRVKKLLDKVYDTTSDSAKLRSWYNDYKYASTRLALTATRDAERQFRNDLFATFTRAISDPSRVASYAFFATDKSGDNLLKWRKDLITKHKSAPTLDPLFKFLFEDNLLRWSSKSSITSLLNRAFTLFPQSAMLKDLKAWGWMTTTYTAYNRPVDLFVIAFKEHASLLSKGLKDALDKSIVAMELSDLSNLKVVSIETLVRRYSEGSSMAQLRLLATPRVDVPTPGPPKDVPKPIPIDVKPPVDDRRPITDDRTVDPNPPKRENPSPDPLVVPPPPSATSTVYVSNDGTLTKTGASGALAQLASIGVAMDRGRDQLKWIFPHVRRIVRGDFDLQHPTRDSAFFGDLDQDADILIGNPLVIAPLLKVIAPFVKALLSGKKGSFVTKLVELASKLINGLKKVSAGLNRAVDVANTIIQPDGDSPDVDDTHSPVNRIIPTLPSFTSDDSFSDLNKQSQPDVHRTLSNRDLVSLTVDMAVPPDQVDTNHDSQPGTSNFSNPDDQRFAPTDTQSGDDALNDTFSDGNDPEADALRGDIYDDIIGGVAFMGDMEESD